MVKSYFGSGVAVGVGVTVSFAVGDGVGVTVAFAVGDGLGDGLGVTVGDGMGVAVAFVELDAGLGVTDVVVAASLWPGDVDAEGEGVSLAGCELLEPAADEGIVEGVEEFVIADSFSATTMAGWTTCDNAGQA